MTSYKNSNGVKKRIIFDLVLLIAIFYVPWWVIGIAAFIGVFMYPLYYEIIIVGVILDILYGAHLYPISGTYNTLSAIVIFFVASYLRKAVR